MTAINSILSRSNLKPGFYDEPEFLALEQNNPAVLEDYARYVLNRKRSHEEDTRTRRVVQSIAEAIGAESSLNDRLGNCANYSMAIMRMLEAQGIWCFMVKGSIRFDFAPELKLEPQHFWVRDISLDFEGGFMGHAWVVAPPFVILDFTIGSQRMLHGENDYIPHNVILEEPNAPASAPLLVLYHADPNHRPSSFRQTPDLAKLWRSLPPRIVVADKVKITYQPDGVSAPDIGLGAMQRPSIGGRIPSTFYQECVQPKLASD